MDVLIFTHLFQLCFKRKINVLMNRQNKVNFYKSSILVCLTTFFKKELIVLMGLLSVFVSMIGFVVLFIRCCLCSRARLILLEHCIKGTALSLAMNAWTSRMAG